MTTSLKSRITKDAVLAYKHALSFHNAPLPVDPAARQLHQQDYYQATEALRVALDRSRCRVEILDTIGSDDVPYFARSKGQAFIDDWHGAVAIRRELEQLTEMADG